MWLKDSTHVLYTPTVYMHSSISFDERDIAFSLLEKIPGDTILYTWPKLSMEIKVRGFWLVGL